MWVGDQIGVWRYFLIEEIPDPVGDFRKQVNAICKANGQMLVINRYGKVRLALTSKMMKEIADVHKAIPPQEPCLL